MCNSIEQAKIYCKQAFYKPDTSESKNTCKETKNGKTRTSFCDQIQHLFFCVAELRERKKIDINLDHCPIACQNDNDK